MQYRVFHGIAKKNNLIKNEGLLIKLRMFFMRIINKSLLILFFTFWVMTSSAIIVDLTCPFPDKIEFIPMNNQYHLAMAEINILTPKGFPAFLLQGVTELSAPAAFRKVVYSRNRLDCYYGPNLELDLSTDDDKEFSYCHFINKNASECVGNPLECKLSCDITNITLSNINNGN